VVQAITCASTKTNMHIVQSIGVGAVKPNINSKVSVSKKWYQYITNNRVHYSYCDPLFSSSADSWRPKKFTKYLHPLNLIVSKAVTSDSFIFRSEVD